MGEINENFLKGYFQESAKVIASVSNEIDVIKSMALEIYNSNKNGNKVLIGGNGGSCADAEHFAGELLCTFKGRDRSALAAVSLSNNASAITAWANDFDFTSYFTRQVDALGLSLIHI